MDGKVAFVIIAVVFFERMRLLAFVVVAAASSSVIRCAAVNMGIYTVRSTISRATRGDAARARGSRRQRSLCAHTYHLVPRSEGK